MSLDAPPQTKKLGPQDPPLLGGGGLFGGSSTTNTGGGLFGGSTAASSTTNTGGSLFGGSTAASSTTNTGGGLFGNTTTSTTTNTGGSLFGNSNTGGGLFGNTTTSSTTNTGGSLFGNSNTGGGLFGNSNTGGGLFGNSNTGGGLFGNSNTGGGLFGNSNTGLGSLGAGGLFAPNNNNNNNNQVKYEIHTTDKGRACVVNNTFYPGYSPQDVEKLYALKAKYENARHALPPILQGFLDIYLQYNPCSEKCSFTTFFYDKIALDAPLDTAARLCKGLVSAKDWEAAVKANPSPGTLVPVAYRGFWGVAYRAEEIAKKNAELKGLFEENRKILNDSKAYGSTISAKLAELRKRQEVQMKRLASLATRMKGVNVMVENDETDEELLSKLEVLRYRMTAQSVKEKAQELAFKKDRIKVYAGLAVERKKELVIGEEQLDVLSKHLMAQQKSILKLANALNSAKENVKKLEERETREKEKKKAPLF